MGLLDLFRPKWKHSRGDVRLEAVRELGEDETSTLTEIARRDPDTKIREVALRKLSDPKLLNELARDERDEALRELLRKKLSEISLREALESADDAAAVSAVERITLPKMLVDVIRKASSSAARHRALLRLDDPRSLAEVAQKAEDPQMRLEALAKIGEPKVLRDLALGEATKAVQMLAVERLADPTALRAISERGRNKAVRLAAKEKLSALGVSTEGNGKKEPKAKKGGDANAEARLKQRKIETEMRRRAEEERKHAVEGKKARLEAEHMERLHRLEAEEAAQKAAPKPAEKHVFEEAAPSESAARVRTPRELSPEEQERKRARDAEKAEREAEKARKVADRAAQAHGNAEQLESIVVRLESLAAGEDMKEAGAALKEAQASQAVRGPLPDDAAPLRARYDAARTKLAARLTELREAEDWRRFSNLPKFDALCVRAESLAKVVIGAVKLEEGQELDARKVSRELRAMQQEWKTLGRPPKEKADQLWERFKASCDIIYEGNKKGLDAVDEDRQANLKMKTELCEKVEALVASAEASSNAKGISEQLKQLQEDWKKIGPVPKDDNEAIWKRFRAACDKFFDSRKQTFEKHDGERAATLEKQLELVARAESLKGSIDFRVTAEKMKALQEEWKRLGPGKKGESDEAWKKFRAACDEFFERRQAHFAEQDGEREENLKKKEALVAEATRLAASDEEVDADAKIRELMAEWKKVGPVAKEHGDEIWARFGKALDALRTPEPPPPEAAAPATPFKFDSLAGKLAAVAETAAVPVPLPPASASPSASPSPSPSASASPSASPSPSVSPTPPPSPIPSPTPSPTTPPVAATPEPAPEAKPEQDAWPATEAWTLPDDEG